MNTTRRSSLSNLLLSILKAITEGLDKVTEATEVLMDEILPEWRDNYARMNFDVGSRSPLRLSKSEARRIKRNQRKDLLLWVSVGILQCTLWVIGFLADITMDFTEGLTKTLEGKKVAETETPL